MRNIKAVTLVIISLTIVCQNLLAQNTYFVSQFGSDTNAGTTSKYPWKTLNKINKALLKDGDIVLFKRGDVFTGQLIPPSDGITFAAYGIGEKPRINGNSYINTKWIKIPGIPIWKTTFEKKKPAQITNLFKGSTKLNLSRHPNKDKNNGYLNYESHQGLNMITDEDNNGNIDWTNSELIIRTSRYTLQKFITSKHNRGNLTVSNYEKVDNLTNNYGYFFINNIKAIDQAGEWAYDATIGSLYIFSNEDLNDFEISYSDESIPVLIANKKLVTIKDLQISNSGKCSVYIKDSEYITIKATKIVNSGGVSLPKNRTVKKRDFQI